MSAKKMILNTPAAYEDSEENILPPKSKADRLVEHYRSEGKRRDCVSTQWLYKYDDPKNGSETTGIGKFVGDEMKDPHEIGLMFGAGRYGIKLYIAKGNAKEESQDYCVVKLHEIYDRYKAEAEAEKHRTELARMNGGQQLVTIPGTGSSSTSESFLMIKEILALILPVVQQANKAAAIPTAQISPRQETPAEMLNSYAMMQKILKTNLFDTAETLKQFSRRYQGAAIDAELDENETEPEEKERPLVEKIIEMIEPFFNLIASKSPAASIAAQGLRAAPQFLEIINDPALCRMIVQHFDRTKGRAAADLALNAIGINRAALFQQSQQTAPGGAAPRQTQQMPPPAASRPLNGKRTATKQQEAAATTAKT